MNTLDAIFALVLSASWRAGCLVLLLLALRRLLRGRIPADAMFGCWVALMLALLVPVAVPSSWSPFNLAKPPTLKLAEPVIVAAPPVAPNVASGIPAATSLPLFQSNPPSAGPVSAVQALQRSAAAPAAADVGSGVQNVGAKRWLAMLWVAGVVVVLLRRIAAEWRFARELRRRLEPVSPGLEDAVHRAAARLGLEAPPAIASTPLVHSPALQGILRPRLLLPRRVTDRLDVQELDLVLLHELGHLRRRDLLSCAILDLATALHWFNPLVWLGRRLARIDCEHACDAFVLGRLQPEGHAAYGFTLLKVISIAGQGGRCPSALGIFENSDQLKQRIVRIAAHTAPRWLGTLAGAALLMAIGLVALTRESSGQPVAPTVPVVLQFDIDGNQRAGQLAASIEAIRQRLAGFGVESPLVRAEGMTRLEVRLPAALAGQPGIVEHLAAPGRIELRSVHPTAGGAGAAPAGYEALILNSVAPDGATRSEAVHVRLRPELSGPFVTRATAQRNALGRPEVVVELSGEGRRQLQVLTGSVVDAARATGTTGRIAIVIDGRLHSAPTVRQAIDSATIQITGTFTMEEATALANQLSHPLGVNLVPVAAATPVAPAASASVDGQPGTQPQPTPGQASGLLPATAASGMLTVDHDVRGFSNARLGDAAGPQLSTVRLAVASDGTLTWNRQPLAPVDLAPLLAGLSGTPVRFLIEADPAARASVVFGFVVDEVRKAQFREVFFEFIDTPIRPPVQATPSANGLVISRASLGSPPIPVQFPVRLPGSGTGPASRELLVLQVEGGRSILWNGAAIPIDELPARLGQWRQQEGAQARVVLLGGPGILMREALQVIDLLRRTGVQDVTLESRSFAPEAAAPVVSRTVSELEVDVANRRSAIAGLSQTYREQHPLLLQAQAELRAAQEELAKAIAAAMAAAPRRATVTGEVRKRGEIEFGTEATLPLTSAIARAGGFTDLGHGQRVTVRRTLPDGTVTTFGPFDVPAWLAGRNLGQGIFAIQPGDIVVVPIRVF